MEPPALPAHGTAGERDLVRASRNRICSAGLCMIAVGSAPSPRRRTRPAAGAGCSARTLRCLPPGRQPPAFWKMMGHTVSACQAGMLTGSLLGARPCSALSRFCPAAACISMSTPGGHGQAGRSPPRPAAVCGAGADQAERPARQLAPEAQCGLTAHSRQRWSHRWTKVQGDDQPRG